MKRAAILTVCAMLIVAVTYLLTMYRVARQCIQQGGWQHAYHDYECRQAL